MASHFSAICEAVVKYLQTSFHVPIDKFWSVSELHLGGPFVPSHNFTTFHNISQQYKPHQITIVDGWPSKGCTAASTAPFSEAMSATGFSGCASDASEFTKRQPLHMKKIEEKWTWLNLITTSLSIHVPLVTLVPDQAVNFMPSCKACRKLVTLS